MFPSKKLSTGVLGNAFPSTVNFFTFFAIISRLDTISVIMSMI